MIKKIISFCFVLLISVFLLSCSDVFFKITNGDNLEIKVGDELKLNVQKGFLEGDVEFFSSSSCVSVSKDGIVKGTEKGSSFVVARLENQSYTIKVVVREKDVLSIHLSIDKKIVKVNEVATLKVDVDPIERKKDAVIVVTEGNNLVRVNGNTVETMAIGDAKFKVMIDDVLSNEVSLTIVDDELKIESLTLQANKTSSFIGEEVTLYHFVIPSSFENSISFEITKGNEIATLRDNVLMCKNEGEVEIRCFIGDYYSNTIKITISDLIKDPYEHMTKAEFYSRYEEATSPKDSYYRSLHGFMSGSIEPQDQEPTRSLNRPKENGKYLRNSSSYYSKSKDTYYIVNYKGEIVDKVFKDGAYVALEEVAAYLLAFGDVPKNYTESKSASPKSSMWGEYLRLNHTYFSGDVYQYPYEPILPNINGIGGDLNYYELDIGTTGTDCDPKYPSKLYNDGKLVTRGAARIVYTRYDKNYREITSINDKYLFYTYNHYNDFEEYLNYYGGWGEMFGNITGGGKISSREYYNPTSYPDVIMREFGLSL